MAEAQELLKAEERIIRRYLFNGVDRMPAARALDTIVAALRDHTRHAQQTPVSVYELDDEAYARFVEALGGNKPPTQALIDLMRSYEKVKSDVSSLRAPEAADDKDARIASLLADIDLLETNAGIQAKLLADIKRAADAGAVSAPVMWVCFAADSQFIRAWTKDGVRAARFADEGLDMMALYASPTAAGIAAQPTGAWSKLQELWAAISGHGPRCRDCADSDGTCRNDKDNRPCEPHARALYDLAKLKAAAPPAVSADAVRMRELAEEYDAGTAKCRASGYAEFGEQFFEDRRLISAALRTAAMSAPVAGDDAGMRERTNALLETCPYNESNECLLEQHSFGPCLCAMLSPDAGTTQVPSTERGAATDGA